MSKQEQQSKTKNLYLLGEGEVVERLRKNGYYILEEKQDRKILGVKNPKKINKIKGESENKITLTVVKEEKNEESNKEEYEYKEIFSISQGKLKNILMDKFEDQNNVSTEEVENINITKIMMLYYILWELDLINLYDYNISYDIGDSINIDKTTDGKVDSRTIDMFIPVIYSGFNKVYLLSET